MAITGILGRNFETVSKKNTGGRRTQSMDATYVRAHQSAAGYRWGQKNQALGRSKGGFTSKIHLKTDAYRRPLAFFLTGGEVHDVLMGESLILGSQDAFLLADRGYDCDKLREKNSCAKNDSGDSWLFELLNER